jgi:type II secretory pathway component GspD/PulD (secretin)/tetratricopeptide (TPR) repeat protein
MRTSSPILGALATTVALLGCTSGDHTEAPADATGAAAAGHPGAAPVQRDPARQEAHGQMSSTLVQGFVADAKARMEKGDFEGARTSISNAFELDPSNAEVNTLRSAIDAKLGGREGAVADVTRQQADLDRVRRTQARLEVENKLVESQRLEEAQDLSGAIRALQDAELILRWNPYLGGSTESGTTEASLRERIAKLQSQKASYERTVSAEREKRAAEEKRERETEERQKTQNLVTRFLQQANDAFYAEKYKESATFCDKVLELEPKNNDAAKLRAIALDAQHNSELDRYRTDFKNHWREVFDQIDQMNEPVLDDLAFPSSEYWAKIVSRGPIHFHVQGENVKPEDQRIWDILNNTAIELNFEETKLPDAIEWFHVNTGVNFLIEQAVLDNAGDTTSSIKVPPQRTKEALDLVCENFKVAYIVRDGIIRVVAADAAKGDQYVEMYDVRDLVTKVANFPSSDFNLRPSEKGGEEEAPESGDPITLFDGDGLMTLIKNNIDPTTWEGGATIALQASGAMVVKQSRETHKKIDRLLKDLRANSRTMINIQTRFLSLEDRFLEDIGVDFRGLNGQNGSSASASVPNAPLDDFGTPGSGGVGTPTNPAGIGTGNDAGAFFVDSHDQDLNLRGRVENLYDLALGDQNFKATGGASVQFTYFSDTIAEAILRAVSKSSNSEVIHAPNLTVYNGQRAHINVLNHISYVKDFEVEIAQGAVIADPIVAILRNGPQLDVRPVVSSDRRFVTMEVRPTLLDLVEPIQIFRTSLAVGNEVELQLPEMHIQRLRTTVTIPDGSTLLLGGMKQLVDKKLNSGVPFLKDIPIISFFVSRNGTEMTKKKIMILVRAKILLPEEWEPVVAK